METIVVLDSGQLHHRSTIHVTPINIPLEYPCQSHSSPGPSSGGSFYDYRSPTTSSHILTDGGIAHLTPVTHSELHKTGLM